MKRLKIFTVLAAILLVFVSCAKPKDEGALSIKYFDDAASASKAFVSGAYDYALLAEPSASMAVKNRQDGNGKILFDIQELYGEGGYPQAVMMVKASLLQGYPQFVAGLIAQMQANEQWLFDNAANAVAAILKNSASGQTALLAAALTEGAITNSNISVKLAPEAKETVTKYLNDVKAVDSDAVGDVSDSFFAAVPNGENINAERQNIKIAAPDGAPALAIAKLMHENWQVDGELYNVTYSVINAAQIGAQVNTSDIIIMPINAASKILGSGESYKMVTVNTHGNLYIVGLKDFEGGLENLKGKTLASFGFGLVPDLTMRIILNKNNINFEKAV